jgi:predicted nucleic-acid-binding Zn-ribbon protein
MGINQIIECVKCGYKETHPFDERELTPYDVWKDGCPKCKNKIIDETIIIIRK